MADKNTDEGATRQYMQVGLKSHIYNNGSWRAYNFELTQLDLSLRNFMSISQVIQ